MNWGITTFFENRNDFEMVIDAASKFPLSYVEIRGERPFFTPDDLTEADLNYFKKIIIKSRLKTTLHATFYDINLSSTNSYIRKATLECYKKYIDMAASIGSEILIVHGGFIHRDSVNLSKIITIAKNNLVENLSLLGDYAKISGVKIGLENSPPNPNSLMVSDWNSQIKVLKEVNHSNVRAVFDMAHAFLHKLNLYQYYDKIRDYLIEIHAHNNDGSSDKHQAIDRGSIDYFNFFKQRKVTVPVILEIHNISEAMDSLNWIKKFEDYQ